MDPSFLVLDLHFSFLSPPSLEKRERGGGRGGELVSVRGVFTRCSLPNELVVLGVYGVCMCVWLGFIFYHLFKKIFQPSPKQE